jgi:hypothetical protein
VYKAVQVGDKRKAKSLQKLILKSTAARLLAIRKVFNKESKQNRYSSKKLLDKAFPSVPYSEGKHINVKGEKSPYDGDLSYWSERNSKLYDSHTSKALKRQSHKCGHCGLKTLSNEKVHLHHIDGNHQNWKTKNLLAIHFHLPRLYSYQQKRKLRTSEATA